MLPAPAATGAADSLLDALDRAIARYPHSVERREARIAALKRQVAEADTASLEYFRLNEAVYNEYRVFVCDSAVHYLGRNLRWANRRGPARPGRVHPAEAGLPDGVGRAVRRSVALLLEQVDRPRLADSLLAGYFNAARHLYQEMSLYAINDGFRDGFLRRAACYDDSLMQVLPPSAPLYLERREMRASDAGRPEEALQFNDLRLSQTGEGTLEYASLAYFRSQHYRKPGQPRGAEALPHPFRPGRPAPGCQRPRLAVEPGPSSCTRRATWSAPTATSVSRGNCSATSTPAAAASRRRKSCRSSG